MLPNQATIDAMAAKFGGRTVDGLAKKYGDGTVHILPLKQTVCHERTTKHLAWRGRKISHRSLSCIWVRPQFMGDCGEEILPWEIRGQAPQPRNRGLQPALFLAKRFDRLDVGRAPGRQVSGDQPDAC
jgi:hypothetical protein